MGEIMSMSLSKRADCPRLTNNHSVDWRSNCPKAEIVRTWKTGAATRPGSLTPLTQDAHVANLENKLRERLGTKVRLRYAHGKGGLEIFDAVGKKVRHLVLPGHRGEIPIDPAGLNSGVYIYHLLRGNSLAATGKLVVL